MLPAIPADGFDVWPATVAVEYVDDLGVEYTWKLVNDADAQTFATNGVLVTFDEAEQEWDVVIDSVSVGSLPLSWWLFSPHSLTGSDEWRVFYADVSGSRLPVATPIFIRAFLAGMVLDFGSIPIWLILRVGTSPARELPKFGD